MANCTWGCVCGIALAVLFTSLVTSCGAISISFTLTSYTVRERDGNATVCVAGNLDDKDSLTVHIYTEDVTASASLDYKQVNQKMVIQSGKPLCLNISIRQDGTGEGAEQFKVSASHGQMGPNATTTVTILDNNVIVIGFSSSKYMVVAGEGVELVAMVIAGELVETVLLSVSTKDGTARAPGDYQPISGQSFNLTPTTPSARVTLRTARNGTGTGNGTRTRPGSEAGVTGSKTLTAVLQVSPVAGGNGASQTVILDPSTATVEILDEERGGGGGGGGGGALSGGKDGVVAVATGGVALLVVLAVLVAMAAAILWVLRQRRERERERRGGKVREGTLSVLSDQTFNSQAPLQGSKVKGGTEVMDWVCVGDLESNYEILGPRYENIGQGCLQAGHDYSEVGPRDSQVGRSRYEEASPYLEPVQTKGT